MKKNLFYAGMLLLGMTVATGCSNEETLEQVASNGKTIQAVIENVTEARTSVSDDYKVLWTEDDAFSVFDNGTKKATLTLSDGEGTTSGKFTIKDSEVTITENMVALFPESETLGYTFATNYTSQETDAPMLGTFENGKFTFSLLTAMVRVVVTNVPAGDATLTITADSNIKLTGDATLNNNSLNAPTSGTNTVAVTIANQTEGATLTFDVPIPVQEYTNGLNVKLTVDSDEEFDKTTNGFTAEAGKIYVFGAKTVSIDTTDDLTPTIQDLLEGGYSVVLEGVAEVVAVSGLSVPENITASLDLNGKKLKLGETATLAAKAAVEENFSAGLVNEGTLTIVNGTITDNTNSFVINNKEGATLTLEGVTIETENSGVNNYGTAILNCTITAANGNAVRNVGVGDLTINGGSYTTSGTEKAALYGGYDTVDSAWKLTINGGTFESKNFTCLSLNNNLHNLQSPGSATLNGGTFKGALYDLYIGCATVDYSDECVFENKKVIVWYSSYGKSKVNAIEVQQDGYLIMTEEQMIEAVSKEGSYVLGGSLTLENALEIEKDITIDLADYTLTANGSKKTSLYEGYSAYDVNGNITVRKDAKATFKNGQIVGEETAILNDKGVLTIEGVEITSNGTAVYVANNGDWENWYGKNGAPNPSVTATISSSTLTSSEKHGVRALGYTGVTLNDVTVEAAENALSLESCVATISGGTYEGNQYGLHVFATQVTTSGNPTITGSSYKYYVQICDESDASHSTKYSSKIDVQEWTDLTSANSGHGFLVEND